MDNEGGNEVELTSTEASSMYASSAETVDKGHCFNCKAAREVGEPKTKLLLGAKLDDYPGCDQIISSYLKKAGKNPHGPCSLSIYASYDRLYIYSIVPQCKINGMMKLRPLQRFHYVGDWNNNIQSVTVNWREKMRKRWLLD
ncbi:hypothetical protein Nepgr_031720 [Nepenthes gracilis]|uniref:Uncharacterized protein n=1 Tax=Nepenthes gracilis TaxID=150966 RepID=A0AAD3Y526_NEPGR|nr:hypothetical protein Nepgr_031720 [Nepenthes gracilis]